MAAQYGKHVWVEKPMAISVEECLVMIEACKEANVQLMVGHSHAFDRPVLKTRDLILSNRYGSVQMVMALNYTDFLYRPRRPEELITHLGGGVISVKGRIKLMWSAGYAEAMCSASMPMPSPGTRAEAVKAHTTRF
jgi:predicted dehydrogenase